MTTHEPCVLTELCSTTIAGHRCKLPGQLLISLSFPRHSFPVVSKPAIMAAQRRPSDPSFSRPLKTLFHSVFVSLPTLQRCECRPVSHDMIV